jgi:hypothetical protein
MLEIPNFFMVEMSGRPYFRYSQFTVDEASCAGPYFEMEFFKSI